MSSVWSGEEQQLDVGVTTYGNHTHLELFSKCSDTGVHRDEEDHRPHSGKNGGPHGEPEHDQGDQDLQGG